MSPNSAKFDKNPIVGRSHGILNIEEDKVFVYCLVVSIGLHLATLLGFYLTKLRLPIKPLKKKIEVFYQAARPVPAIEEPRPEARRIQERKEMSNPQILTKEDISPQSFIKELMKPPAKEMHSKQSSRLTMDTKRQVSISVLKTDKIMNPRYLKFEDSLREKISNRAHFYANQPGFEVGEVYLTFVLLSDGSLKEVKIIDEKTRANDFLRNIGIRSIKESSPFPNFPKDLKCPELTFNVIISFEMGEQ